MVKVGGNLKIFIIYIISISLISIFLSGCLKTNRHVTICDIQDDGKRSPFFMQAVSVTGVTSVKLNDDIQSGLFLQDDHCERGEETKRSSGLFVLYDDEFELVSIGDEVNVTGIVIEYAQETLLIAETDSLQVVSVSNPLPDVISLSLKPQEIDPFLILRF